MREEYRIIYQGAQAQIAEKKSRFIATVVSVETEEEALGFIESMRKKYWDATLCDWGQAGDPALQ